MQLSVIPHLTIYGDVEKSQLKRGLIASSIDKIKYLTGKENTTIMVRPELSETEFKMVSLVEQLKRSNTGELMMRGDLDKASG